MKIGKIAILKKTDGFKSSSVKTSLFLLLFITIAFFGIPQTPSSNKNPKITRIIIEHADSIELGQGNNKPNILRGNVQFRHDSAFMSCDSAYSYNLSNSFEAFDNVHIVQGDTLNISGDYLNYFGNIRLAKLRENVRMENKGTTLFTDSFDYDRGKNLGFYFNGGMLVDSVNELTSVYGQYSPDTKMAYFKNKVRLKNPQFTLTSDTLVYNTDTKVATIVSPTVIEADSGYVYTDKGWYNTESGKSMLYNRSTVISKDKTKMITADSLNYDRTEGRVEAFGDMVVNDTLKKIIIMGNYGYYDENTEYTFATDSAQMIEYSQKDSTFLHADTLLMLTIDTIRDVRAYYGVRFYRIDLQGVCDSLQYLTVDSTIRLYKNPILWNDSYQITGDTIKILFNDSTIERMNVINYAFATQEIDSTYYNQLKGRMLTAYFDAGEIYQVDVEGNGEVIYYNIDNKTAAPLQLSKLAGSFFTFMVEKRKIKRITWYTEPKLDIVPIPNLTPELKFLQDFKDYNYLRPKNKEDIFVKQVMKAEDIPPPRRARNRSRQE